MGKIRTRFSSALRARLTYTIRRAFIGKSLSMISDPTPQYLCALHRHCHVTSTRHPLPQLTLLFRSYTHARLPSCRDAFLHNFMTNSGTLNFSGLLVARFLPISYVYTAKTCSGSCPMEASHLPSGEKARRPTPTRWSAGSWPDPSPAPAAHTTPGFIS